MFYSFHSSSIALNYLCKPALNGSFYYPTHLHKQFYINYEISLILTCWCPSLLFLNDYLLNGFMIHNDLPEQSISVEIARYSLEIIDDHGNDNGDE